MKMLVTGGCGFIGSNLVDKLVEQDHEVIVIDNLSSDANEQFYFNPEVSYYKYDICDYEEIEPLFKKVDYVFHLAAEARIQPTIKDPQKACMVNFVGTCNVLQASRKHKIKRLMFSSTSSAYAGNKPPFTEDMKTSSLSPYTASKVGSENLCKIYTDLFNLETVIFRYFNVYGPREPVRGLYAPVIGRFLKQRKKGNPMTIVNPGTQSRDFTHVDDVVNANILASTAKNVAGEIINVGTGKSHTILELAKLIGGKYKFIPERPGEYSQTRADNSKIKKLLNWKPTIKLNDYIDEQRKRTIQRT